MNALKCYTYDPYNNILRFEIDTPIDINGNPVIPSYATTAVPPKLNQLNKAIVFSQLSGIWNIEDDYRGQTWYNKENKSEYLVTTLGTPTSSFTNIYPTSGSFEWNELSGNWVLDRDTQIDYLMQNVIDYNTDNIVLPSGAVWTRPSDNVQFNVPLAADKIISYNQAVDGYIKGIFTLPLLIKGYETNFISLNTSADVNAIQVFAYNEVSNIITSGWMLKYGGEQFGVSSIKALSAMSNEELLLFRDPRI